jgi:hypothetical protein
MSLEELYLEDTTDMAICIDEEVSRVAAHVQGCLQVTGSLTSSVVATHSSS